MNENVRVLTIGLTANQYITETEGGGANVERYLRCLVSRHVSAVQR